jgi:hypothetical protein
LRVIADNDDDNDGDHEVKVYGGGGDWGEQ